MPTGKAVCEALVRCGKFDVYGTTRKGSSSTLKRLGVTSVAFRFGDAFSIASALKSSEAEAVFFLTDFFNAAQRQTEVEVKHGKVIIGPDPLLLTL